MFIEPSAVVVEGIRTQQVLRRLLVREGSLHDMRTKLWVFSQPGEEVVHIDIVIRHSDSLPIGPTAGKRRPERLQVGYECGQAARALALSNPADTACRAIANQKPCVGINPIKDDAMRDCFALGGSSG